MEKWTDINKINCYSCRFFDKNDPVHCYGTCELQDEDFHISHECNIEDERQSVVFMLATVTLCFAMAQVVRLYIWLFRKREA